AGVLTILRRRPSRARIAYALIAPRRAARAPLVALSSVRCGTALVDALASKPAKKPRRSPL
ncbi:MAG: hypothetical protein KC636_30560, partial [Myxococcales bacterium]|nr:hypothetical protein [Myxococcales bacterium]